MKRSVLINLISSMLATILVVIAVLLVMVFTGKLDVQQHKLVISSASHTITYDGKPLVDGKWSLMEGSLKTGHRLVVSVTGTQTNVGMSENYISATVVNDNGEDMTEQYNIEYRPGALQVKARELTVVADSDMKLYDGTPLTCNAYMLQSGVSLLSSDQLRVTVEGSITEVGETDNVVTSVTVFSKATGEDVSRNYNIHSKNGKLIIYDENALVIKSGDAIKAYDGKPLTGENTECEIENGALKDGHSMKITYTGKQLLPGTSENTFDVTIVDAEGNDVTNQYQILKNYGTLIVKNAKVASIQGLNAVSEYGVGGLSSVSYTLPEDFPEGHRLVLDDAFDDSPQFEVGTFPADFDKDKIKVLNEKGEDVTEYFDFGELDPNATMEVLEDYVCFEVTANTVGDIYLKQASYGNYNLETKSWEDAPEYSVTDLPISSAYYFASKALGTTAALAEITPKVGIFAMPYYAVDQSGNQQQSSDVRMEGDGTVAYTVSYYTGDPLNQSTTTLSTVLAPHEAAYAAFVKENYLSVDAETMEFLQGYALTNRLASTNQKELIKMVAEHLQSTAKSGLVYNMQYDRAMDEADNPTKAFLNQYREGVCRHYAQAATLLYRSLGIPARYTVGFHSYATAANQTFAVTNKQAHAWVEVYLDGIGWVYVEVTGSLPRFKLTPENVEGLYVDGAEPLGPKQVKIESIGEDWSEWKELGYTMELAYTGARSTPGKSKSTISKCIIKDPKGNIVYQYEDGYATRDAMMLEMTYEKGDVHLYRAEIWVDTGTFFKEYGADEWSDDISMKHSLNDFDDWEVTEGSASVTDLLDGHTFTAIPIAASNPKNTQPGKYGNTYQFLVGDLGEYTGEYKFVYSGELTITPRTITILTGDATAVANGLPQTYADATEKQDPVVLNQLVAGDEIDWSTFEVISEEATNAGDIALVIGDAEKLKIRDADGNDVTDCYAVTFLAGILTIVEP